MRDTLALYLDMVRRRLSRQRKAFAVLLALSFVVAFGVTWSLHLTGESKTAHTHDASCYTTEMELTCERAEHIHTDECYDEEGSLICGLEEHEHTDGECYSPVRELVCGLEEHTHSDACYDAEGNLTCGLEEHTHDDACYTEKQVLICGLEETPAADTAAGGSGETADEADSGEDTAVGIEDTDSSSEDNGTVPADDTTDSGTATPETVGGTEAANDGIMLADDTTGGEEEDDDDTAATETTEQTTVSGTAAYESAVQTSSGDTSAQVDYVFNIDATSGMKTKGFTIASNFYLESLDSNNLTKYLVSTGEEHYIKTVELYGIDRNGDETLLTLNADYTLWKDEVSPYNVIVSVKPSDNYESYQLKSYGYLNLEPVDTSGNKIEWTKSDGTTTYYTIDNLLTGDGNLGQWKLLADVTVYEEITTDDNDDTTATTLDSSKSVGSKQVKLQKAAESVTDLGELVTSMKILQNDVEVGANETLKTNTDYTFSFTFAESSAAGNLKQFSSEMTYELPDKLDFLSVNEDGTLVYPEGTLTYKGSHIGSYTVQKNNETGKQELVVNITDDDFLDGSHVSSITMSFTGQFATKDTQQPTKVNYGENSSVRVTLIEGTGLKVDKSSASNKEEQYDAEKNQYYLEYEVKVKNYGAAVSAFTLEDTMYAAVTEKLLKYDTENNITITRTKTDNTTETIKDYTIETGFSGDRSQNRTMTISGMKTADGKALTLEKGETITIKYRMYFDLDGVGDYSQYIGNEAVASGKNANTGEDMPRDARDSEAFTVGLEILKKTADGATRDGDKTYVTWRVNVNTYSNTETNNLAGTVLTDTLTDGVEEGHVYCWADGTDDGDFEKVKVTITKLVTGENGEVDTTTKKEVEITPEKVTDENGTYYTLTLPEKDADGNDLGTYYSAELVYYTRLPTPTPATGNITVENTIAGKVDKIDYTDEDSLVINPYVDFQDVTKTGILKKDETTDEEYVEYTFKATVPAGMKGWLLRINDYLKMIEVDNEDAGTTKNVVNDIELVSIKATSTADSTRVYTFTEWKTGERPVDANTGNTYTVVKNLQGSKEFFGIMFNVPYDTDNPDWGSYGTASDTSYWNIDEQTELEIVYKVPLSAEVFVKNAEGDETDIGTAADKLAIGWIEQNTMSIASGIDAKSASAEVARNAGDVTKVADVVDEDKGIYKYTVTVFNYDVSKAEDGSTSYRAGASDFYYSQEELINLVFNDTYDSRLELVEGNENYPFEMTMLGYFWSKYYYSPNKPASETITARTGTQNGYVVDEANHTITLDLYDESLLTSGTNGGDANIIIGDMSSGDYWDYKYDGKDPTSTQRNFSDYVNSHELTSASYTTNARFYYAAIQFTYYMKVTDTAKEEAKASTLTMPNTATVTTTSNDKKTNSATATVTYETNILTKTALQQSDSENKLLNRLKYAFTLNPYGKDLKANGDTLTIVDQLPTSLSLWFPTINNAVSTSLRDAIKVYTQAPPDDTSTTRMELDTGQWSAALDGNKLTLTVPDGRALWIEFYCEVLNASTDQDITNDVSLDGSDETVKGSSTISYQKMTSTGQATSSDYQFTIRKTDAAGESLAGAVFDLYYEASITEMTLPEGAEKSITIGSSTYYWYGRYAVDEETGEATISTYKQSSSDGTSMLTHNLVDGGIYVLHEVTTPEGYVRCDDIVFVYRATKGEPESAGVTYIYGDETKTSPYKIVNTTEAYELPGTGGTGMTAIYFTTGGMTAALSLAGLRRKRRRRRGRNERK